MDKILLFGGSGGENSSCAISRRRFLGTTATVSTCSLLAGVAPVQAQAVGFGAVSVGSTRTRRIITENPVDRPIEVTDLTITGSDAEAFTVVNGDAPFTLDADGSQTTRIQFAPTSPGEKSARVQVDTTLRSSLTAGRLTGTGVKGGATSVSAANDTPSESDESSAVESSDDSTADEAASSSVRADNSSNESASMTQSPSTPTDTPSSGTSPTNEDTTDRSVSSSAETDAAADSRTGVENAPGDPTDSGALLTEVLDVNDDGRVNLWDFLAIVRRFGLNVD